MEAHPQKRASAGDGGSSEKRLRAEPEDSGVYSEKIREKLQNSSRTGQACDRCKERKMKCDSSLAGCEPCKKANLSCKATDRITGQAHVRGETARLKKENEGLKAQLHALRNQLDLQNSVQSTPSAFQDAFAPSNGYNGHPQSTQQAASATFGSTDRGGHADGPQRGPIHGTHVDLIDGEIDIADFECPDIEETMKLSQAILPIGTSHRGPATTMLGARKPEKPRMPSREDALQYADNYLKVIATYIPIVHGPSFRQSVMDYYDDPDAFDRRPAETVMITVVLALFTFQMATRNPSMRQEKLVESNLLYQYSLSFYSEILRGESLESMQALTLFLVYVRNLPKPGNSWSFSTMVLSRAIELDYHRSSKKIVLSPPQQNPLAIELRKRVFWSIMCIHVPLSIKMGRPMSISPQDMDVEPPSAILDSEITPQGVLTRSGNCDFWAHIFLSKMLPLSMDLYQNIILVRKPEAEYLRHLDELHSQVSRWRREWDGATANQARTGSHKTATHLIDLWYAEFSIILHHPHLCTSHAAELREKNLAICLRASRTILRNVIALIKKFKGADFTWHAVSVYVLGLSIALHFHTRRREALNAEAIKQMKNELGDWLVVMKSADRCMSSRDYLFTAFHPKVQRCLEDAQNLVTASEAVRYGHAQSQSTPLRLKGTGQPPASSAGPSYTPSPVYSDKANVTPATMKSMQQLQRRYSVQHPGAAATSPASSSARSSSSPTGPQHPSPQHHYQQPPPIPETPIQYEDPYQIPDPQSQPLQTQESPACLSETTNTATTNPSAFYPHNGPGCLAIYPAPLHRTPAPQTQAVNPSTSSTAAAAEVAMAHSLSHSPIARQDHHLANLDVHGYFAHGIWPLNIVQYPHDGWM